MLHFITRGRALALGGILSIGLFGASFAQQAPVVGTTVVSGLDSPRGLHALPGGDVLVSEVGAGRVLRLKPDGTFTEVLTGLPSTQSIASGDLKVIGVASAIGDNSGGFRYVVGESAQPDFSSAYSATFNGATTLLSDLGLYEAQNNTDGATDAQGAPVLTSDPYDIALDGAGGVFVSDSAANAIIRIDVHDNVKPFAVFPALPNPRFPFAGTTTMTQQPTGIEVGPDGALYVATFTGFPHPTGEARVYRLKDKNADGDALDDGESTVFATGLTAATDLAFDLDGSLLVSEYSTDMVQGSLGRISRIVDGEPVAVTYLLTTPTSITVTDTGRILVAQESLGVISDVTDAPAGGFASPIVSGPNITSYNGGSVEQLSAELIGLGATTAAVTDSGKFIVLVPGAPSFVNKDFSNRYPFTVPKGTLMLIQLK